LLEEREVPPDVRIIILHNPASGRRKGREKFLGALARFHNLGVQPEVQESRDPQHLVELARQAAAEKPDVVVSAGGDGTHHYVLNGIFGSDVPLGVLSVGSGNDFATGLGIPLEPSIAASALIYGRPWQIDVARVASPRDPASQEAETRVYACIAGAGFDAIVTRFANDHVHRVHGSAAYAWSILRCLKFYRPFAVDLHSQASNFSGNVIFVTIGNSTRYGGGLKMAPHARLDDGLLDVCVVMEMSKLELLRWIPNAYRGTHLKNPRILYFQTDKVTLHSQSRLELFGDGEFIQELPAIIEAVPRSLNVIVPRK
jgi:diacylglycerol kinase (ATP)